MSVSNTVRIPSFLLLLLWLVTTGSLAAARDLPPSPRLLLNAAEVQALRTRITQKEWRGQWISYKAGVDRSLSAKIGLPPRGGNWSHNYVCPQHGQRLKRGAQLGAWRWEHRCPVDNHVLLGEPRKAVLDFDGNAIMETHLALAKECVDLGVVYQATGELKYAARVRGILAAYSDKYLSYAMHNNYGQPGKGGRVASQPLTESSWIIELTQGADLVWATMSKEERQTLETKILRPALEQVILPDRHGIHNIQCRHNAAIGLVGFLLNDNALIRKAVDDPDTGFRNQISKGVQADGMWYEGAGNYHFFTIDGLWPLAEAARHNGINLYDARFKSMFDGPLTLALPNLTLPNFNDSNFVELRSKSDAYALAFARWQDSRYLPLARTSDQAREHSSRMALLYHAPAKKDVDTSILRGSRFSDASGYAMLEKGSGEAATWLCVKYGPHGGGHGHPDKNHFILYRRGAVIMPDAGARAYGSPLHHTWNKTSLAHNTLIVDETSQSPATGRLIAFGSKDGFDYTMTDAGKIYPGVRFVRTAVMMDENTIIVVDQIRADKEQTYDIAAHFNGQWASRAGTPWEAREVPGYGHLKDAMSSRTIAAWSGAVHGPNKTTTRILLASGVPTEVITANGIGNSPKEVVSTLLLRRVARETAYAWGLTMNGHLNAVDMVPVSTPDGLLPSSSATAVQIRANGKRWILLVNPEKKDVRLSDAAGGFASREEFAVFGGASDKATPVTVDSHAAPSLILLDGALLQRVRAGLQAGEATYRVALEKLKQDTAIALAAKPYSVVAKTLTPPSSDKHDYMSMATYWWPDPTKPDGLPYIRRDGHVSPDVNKVTDKNHLELMANHTQTLALAYYLTGDEKYAAHATRLLKTWFLDPATRMNPNLKYAQAIRGVTEGRGIGIIDTERLLSIPDTVALLDGSKTWNSKDKVALQKWFDEYLTWLLESPNGQEEARERNNHGTIYDAQVTTYALFVGKPELARKTLEQSARLRIANEIEPDGRQLLELERTKGWAYSAKNLGGLMNLAQLGEKVNLDLWNYRSPDGRSIKAALDWMVAVAAGKTPWSYQEIGHSTDWKPKIAPQILRMAERVWPDAGYGSVPGAEGVEPSNRLNLLWPTQSR